LGGDDAARLIKALSVSDGNANWAVMTPPVSIKALSASDGMEALSVSDGMEALSASDGIRPTMPGRN